VNEALLAPLLAATSVAPQVEYPQVGDVVARLVEQVDVRLKRVGVNALRTTSTCTHTGASDVVPQALGAVKERA
jgi:hypothetical protein